MGNLGRLTWIRRQQPQEQRCPLLCSTVVCQKVVNGCQCCCFLLLFFFNVQYTHNYVDARDCIWLGAVGTSEKSLQWKLTLGDKSLTAPGNRTRVSSVPVLLLLFLFCLFVVVAFVVVVAAFLLLFVAVVASFFFSVVFLGGGGGGGFFFVVAFVVVFCFFFVVVLLSFFPFWSDALPTQLSCPEKDPLTHWKSYWPTKTLTCGQTLTHEQTHLSRKYSLTQEQISWPTKSLIPNESTEIWFTDPRTDPLTQSP